MLNTLLVFDQQIFLFVNKLPHPQLLVFLANLLSGAESLGLIWLAIGLLLIYFERHNPKLLLELVIAFIAATFLTQGVIKQIILRLRPEFVLPDVSVYTKTLDYLSFPSNHAATAFAGATILIKIFPRGKVLLFFLAFLIAFSRVYLGVHYPLDVFAGSLIGLGVGLIVVRLTRTVPIKKKVITHSSD